MHSNVLQTLTGYLTASEAAEFLGIDTDILRDWDKSGKLKPINTQSGALYRRQDLLTVADTHCRVEAYNAFIPSIGEVQALLAAVVESSEDAIITKSLEGCILSWNQSAEKLFGYTAHEAIGRSILMLIPSDRRNEEHMIIERLRRGERIDHYETVRVTKDRRLIDISLSISPLCDRNGNVIGASKIARDITEQKRLRNALEEANRRKSEFLATLAHELRNPLAPIKNALHILASPKATAGMKEEARQMMQRQVHQMKRLIDDLMDVSRINQGKIELRKERLALSDAIQTAVEIARPMITEKRHELTITQPHDQIWLEGDKVRLAQVFANLLNNAAKYTNEGGCISLIARREEGEAVICIKDNGIGIPPEKLPVIFDLFVQIDRSLERTQGGLGIGLTLVKELVELHGGSIEASSEGEGKGSEFLIRLPLPTAHTESVPDTPPAEGSGKRHRILVVDDNEASAKTLSWTLEVIGHESKLAEDAETALETARAFRPDVILLDIGLPRISGYELCRRLRQMPETRDATIIAQTGWGQEEHRQRSREAGFDHHLVKPIDIQSLQQLLATLEKK